MYTKVIGSFATQHIFAAQTICPQVTCDTAPPEGSSTGEDEWAY